MSEEHQGEAAAQRLVEWVNREQMCFRTIEVERLVDDEHPARLLWEAVGQLDLSHYYQQIGSSEEKGGRPGKDPRLLISLWVYAYSLGIGSAREIEKRCHYDPAFWWLTGMKEVNHHTLSDFRVQEKEALDELFTQVLGAASAEGFISLEQVTLDGTKIQAHASGKSFHREATLRDHLEKAEALVEKLGKEEEQDNSSAAKQSKAQEKVKRLKQALKEMEKVQSSKKGEEEKRETRVSSTDPEARMMRQANGGKAPSYNVQISADTGSGLIVDVETTQAGNDFQQLVPAVERMEERWGKAPNQMLVDSGYVSRENVDAMATKGIDLLGSLADDAAKANHQGERYDLSHFRYDAEQDHYVCPAGKLLNYEGKQKKDGMLQYKYKADNQDCMECPLKMQCCPENKKNGRSVTRTEESAAMKAFRAKMASAAAQQQYRKRAAVAEFRNLWIKTKLGLRQFHVRGLIKSGTEALWVCLTHNLQHLILLRRQKAVLLAAT